MTFVARSVRYVLRKRVRTIVLLIILTIITASMLSTIAVSRAAQQAAGRIEKEAVGGFVLSSNMQGSMLTPRGGGMVRPADVRRIAQLPGVDSYMVRQNATADLVGADVAKVPGGDDYDATWSSSLATPPTSWARMIRRNSTCSRRARSAWPKDDI